MILVLTAAALLAPQLDVFAGPAAPAPQKKAAEVKRIDWRPLQNAVNEALKAKDNDKYAAALKAIESQPADVQGRTDAIATAVLRKGDNAFAVSYFTEMLKSNLSEQDRNLILGRLMGVYRNQAAAAMKNTWKADEEGFLTAVKNLEGLPAGLRGRTETIIAAVCANPLFAADYLPKMQVAEAEKPRIAKAIFNNRKNLAEFYAREKNRAGFDKVFQEIEALPAGTEGRIEMLASLARYLDGGAARGYLEGLLKQTSDPCEQFIILDALRQTVPLRDRPYEFPEKDNYALNKMWWQKQMELIRADEKLDPKERKLKRFRLATSASQAADFARYAFSFGDYKLVDELLDVWYKGVGDKDIGCAIMRMRNALRKHDAAGAKAIGEAAAPVLRAKLADPKIANNAWQKKHLRNQLAVLVGLPIFNEKMDFAAFDKAVFGDGEINAVDRYLALCYVSAEAFRAGRHDICMAIVNEIRGNMFGPADRLTFKVVYDPACPKTADAWMRTPGSAWENLDTRFKIYGAFFENSHDTAIKRLMKGAQEPPVPEENRAGVSFMYDNEAFHIFVRVNDPAAQEVLEGKRKGPSFEMLFRAGKDVVYNSDYLLNTPDTEQTFPQDWQRPGLDYTLTMDFIRRDIAVTKDAVSVHYGIPFSAFFDKLPLNGREWTFGIQVWGKTPLTLSCGVVHELARMGLLDIKMTREQELAIKRVIIRKALNRAQKMFREQGKPPRLWQDAVVGDPAFYDQEVKPIFDDLIEAEKKAADLKDEEVDAFYEKYARLGMKLEYIVAAKRAAYLRDSLLK